MGLPKHLYGVLRAQWGAVGELLAWDPSEELVAYGEHHNRVLLVSQPVLYFLIFIKKLERMKGFSCYTEP